jgi:hypothetical protein
MITLKRSLFIGLGGTGALALLNTKKRFLDTYGEIPPTASFLSIDTDDNTEKRSLTRDNILVNHNVKDEKVKLDKSEMIYIGVKGAQMTYKKQQDTLFNWLPKENSDALDNLIHGAGQIRSNGRFALHFHYNNIINVVNKKVNELLNMNNTDNSRYEPKGDEIEINFVFSVAGGTGCGTFIDLAYLVKEAIGNTSATSIAFMVLPDIFTNMHSGIAMANVRPNCFGAMRDMDFLMQKNIGDLGLTIKYESREIKIKEKPFDLVFTVNSKNTVGETITNISEIAEQIGLAMFVGASELSANINSAYDNVLPVMSGGALDVLNKKAWAGGVGVSELYYDGNSMGIIYAKKISINLINNLITESNASQNLADNFIDSSDVNIRENDGNDFLIDSLLSKDPISRFPSIDDINDVNSIIDNYINNSQKNSIKQIEENYSEKVSSVDKEFRKELKSILNKDSGVANAIEFLRSLKTQLNIFHNEMDEEEVEFLQKEENLRNQNQADQEYLHSNTGLSSIFNKGVIKSTKRDLSDRTNQLSVTQNEILRRKYAKKFLKQLIAVVEDMNEITSRITKRLKSVKESLAIEVERFSNNVTEKRKTFVIDLHSNEVNKIKVSDDEFVISDFINALTSGNGIYDFHEIGEDVIKGYLWNFTKELKKSLDYRNMKIDDVVRGLSEEKRKDLAKQLISKSNALWNYDYKGYKINPNIHEHFLIGLPQVDSAFKDDFSSLTSSDNLDFVATGVGNKVICYRMEVAVPIYAVNDVESYEKDYKLSNISHHIDANWEANMKRSGYSIYPSQKEDDSLSAWVAGLIFGYVKYDSSDSTFFVKSPKYGDPLQDYWKKLGDYRDVAYSFFVRDQHVDEIIEIIDQEKNKLGEDATKEKFADVVENYLDKYSNNNVKREDLAKREYEQIAQLLRKEIDFVTKDLKKLI